MLRLAALVSIVSLVVVPLTRGAEPLVKPAVPGKTYTRVEFPLTGGGGQCFQIKGIIPTVKDKNKPSTTATNTADIKVGLCSTLPMVTVKTLQSWGYNAGAGQKFTIPSITLVGETMGGSKRNVVNIKLTNLVVDVVKSAYGSEDHALGASLHLTPDQILLGPASQSEFWMTFDNKPTVQVSYPTTQVKKFEELPDVEVKEEAKAIDPEWLPVRLPMQPKSFNFDMKVLHDTPVGTKSKNCMLEIAFTNVDYVYMTRPMAMEYQIKLGNDAPMLFGGDMQIKSASATAINLRLTAANGTGWKTPIEMHYKEIGMLVGLEAMNSVMALTPGYLTPRIHQMQLAVGTDGIPRLYGYTDKTHTIDPKKVEPKKIEPKKK